ncbi:MAG: pullulanase-associated domain-containing protein, partial [Bacillota bacterium]
MRTFRRMIIATLAVFAMLVVSNVSMHAEEADTLVVHYFRFDDDYSQFNSVWLWSDDTGTDGRYKFDEEDDYGMKVTVDLEEEDLVDDEVGVIVRDGEWNKEVSEDRYIDMSEPNSSGEVHAYLVQGESTIYYSEDEADTSQRILSAGFLDSNTIEFSATQTAEEDDVKLLEDDSEISFSDFTMEEGEGTLTMDSEVDLTKSYALEIDFGDEEPDKANIGFDGFYNSDLFNDTYAYDGELGALYSEEETEFKLWAP